jgi:hypothetical protein
MGVDLRLMNCRIEWDVGAGPRAAVGFLGILGV